MTAPTVDNRHLGDFKQLDLPPRLLPSALRHALNAT
jgi:hypothetical protein